MSFIATLKTHVETHVASAEASVKAEFDKFVAFVEGEEAKVAAEIADLKSRGYTVAAPVVESAAAPSALAARNA